MKLYASLLMLAAALAACDSPSNPSATETTSASAAHAPDNTKTNARDKGGAVTPLDQGNNQADLDTTQNIRKAVMADGTLSSDAKNVKIITNAGVITLRGPVKTLAEKNTIENKATAAAGSNRVDDQIDIEAK
jgi:hyperosmotically inducible protein